MTTADLDADGDVDVIIVNIDSENYIFLNEGAGSFSKALVGDFVADRSGSRDVAAGDCDGDGDVDEACSTYDFRMVHLAEGAAAAAAQAGWMVKAVSKL